MLLFLESNPGIQGERLWLSGPGMALGKAHSLSLGPLKRKCGEASPAVRFLGLPSQVATNQRFKMRVTYSPPVVEATSPKPRCLLRTQHLLDCVPARPNSRAECFPVSFSLWGLWTFLACGYIASVPASVFILPSLCCSCLLLFCLL